MKLLNLRNRFRWGLSLQVICLVLMAASKLHFPIAKTIGMGLLFVGVTPVFVIVYPFNHNFLPGDWAGFIYASIFYFFVGFTGRALGEHFSRDSASIRKISAAICIAVIAGIYMFMGVAFWLQRFDS